MHESTIESNRQVCRLSGREVAAMGERGKQGWAGRQLEGIPVVVKAGAAYTAFLTRDSRQGASGLVYTPASAEFSFEILRSRSE